MRSVTILLCFSWVILKPALSIVPFRTRRLSKENFPPDGDEIQVVSRSTSSITISIRLGENVKNRLIGTMVRYRPRFVNQGPATLTWNSSLGYYIAKDSYGLYDSGEIGGPNYRQSASPSRQEEIKISNLRYPGIIYEFEVTSYRENNVTKDSYFDAETRPVQPSDPPKTGAGCFHVYNVNGTTRSVKIYWPHAEDHYMQYEVLAYYYDGKGIRRILFLKQGLMRAGCLWADINLKRHYFIFRALNEYGHSDDVTTVEVPAHEDILPAPRAEVLRSRQSGLYVLSWRVPLLVTKNTNYTVAWFDERDDRGGVRNMKDFVYTCGERNVLWVKADDWVGLAVSINSETGSSGLHPALYEKDDAWTYE